MIDILLLGVFSGELLKWLLHYLEREEENQSVLNHFLVRNLQSCFGWSPGDSAEDMVGWRATESSGTLPAP